jgi:thiamine-monophosphate kinase
LHNAGELNAIQRLTARLKTSDDVVAGIGDDAAVVRADHRHDWVLTSDPLIQDIHFRLDVPGKQIGHKAVGRVLSDLAAMGARPLWLLIDLVAPANTPLPVLEEVYDGASTLAEQFGALIVGGDLAEGPVLELHVFGLGQVTRNRATLRSGASPGDGIFVTGSLGGSRAGHHLTFVPRVAEGQWLQSGQWAAAMIDISDGLASDLRHVLTMSRCGAELDADAIPLSDAAKQHGGNALEHALCDGEDFELLFTVPENRCNDFEKAWHQQFPLACTRIGRIIADKQPQLYIGSSSQGRRLLAEQGFQHFHHAPD